MKKLVYILSFLILFACEKDETIVVLDVSKITPPSITSHQNGDSEEVTEEMLTNQVSFTWNETGYGLNTEVVYKLEADVLCDDFSSPVVIGTTTNSALTFTWDALNTKLVNDLRLAPHQQATIQLRVSSLVNGKFPAASDIISLDVTPWSDKPFALWLGNSVPAQVLYEKSENYYEGYRYMDNQSVFRLLTNPACGGEIWGAGAAEGVLAAGESSGNIVIEDEGYYKFSVNTETLTYSIIRIDTWGMIGTATPGGWGGSTPLNYNAANDTWEAELNLTNGALKFRANNGWDINYGPAATADLQGMLIETNDAISVPADNYYKVVIDFSQSQSPYTYKYSVNVLSNIPEPAKLWLPGGYQNYNPAAAPTIYATGANTFEGYVYISSATGYKFTSAPDWSHTNYGDSGTPGLLSTDGLAPDLSLHAAGYYKFNVNVSTLDYSAVLIETWGLIGTATSGIWDTSTPMAYDPDDNVWTVTANLVPGALKFRANNGWGINYGVGDINALEGNLVWDAASIDIKEAGSYTVTLDFSRSESPYKYTYSVVKN